MRNGTYTIYLIEFRTKAKGEWCNLDSHLKDLPIRDDWYWCGNDYWGKSMIPQIGSGNDRHPKNEVAEKEFRQNYHDTGYAGFTTLKYAVHALKRVRADDSKGMYDSRDGYGKLHQRVRHEFRISKLYMTYNVAISPITVDELVEQV